MLKFFYLTLFFIMFFYNDTFAFNEIAQKCFEKGAAAGHAYYNSEEYKTMIISFDDDECNNASETEKQDIRIRNICLGIIGDAKTNCEIYKCVKDNEGKIDWSFEPLLINPDLTGDEICNVANNPYFCLNDSIETLKNFLNKFGNSLYTADTMDDINTEIQNGKFNTTKIDINKAICYMADSNGNTIWHTFVISGYDAYNVANLCISLSSPNMKSRIYQAAFLDKNKDSKTAIAIAIELDRVNALSFFGDYFMQEKEQCETIVNEIIRDTGAKREKLTPICPKNF